MIMYYVTQHRILQKGKWKNKNFVKIMIQDSGLLNYQI